jgi:DNA-binding transcriptional LysR family regulator
VRMMSAKGAVIAVLPDIYALSEAIWGDDIGLAKIEHDEAQRQISMVYRNDINYMDKIELICGLMKEEYQRLLALNPSW